MQAIRIRFLAFWIALILSVTGVVNHVARAGSPYAAEDAENLQMYAVIVSDLHTNDWTPHVRNTRLLKLFAGVSKSQTPIDALVLPGDLTERAQQKEYCILTKILQTYPCADTIIPATGNHDVRGIMVTEDYEDNMRQYYAFCGAVGVQTEKPYWDKTVKGLRFVVLGSDAEVKDCAYISPEQLQWLESTLENAQENSEPVILVCHQPLEHTNNVDASWPVAGTLGEQSAAVEAILRRFAGAGLPIVYVSGHLHDDFSANTFETQADNLYCLNLPSAQYTDGGGKGVVLEAYADRILLRTRNFVTGEWLPDAYTVPLA